MPVNFKFPNICDYLGDKAKLFGFDIESTFDKLLRDRIGHLLDENGFKLYHVRSEPDGTFGAVVIRIEIRNSGYVIGAMQRISVYEAETYHDRYLFEAGSDYGIGLVRNLLEKLVRQVEDEIHKYIATTPLPMRKKYAGVIEFPTTYMPHLDQEMRKIHHEVSSASRPLNYYRKKYGVPGIESLPLIEIDESKPYRQIAILISESKSRLNKGPAKLDWTFKHF